MAKKKGEKSELTLEDLDKEALRGAKPAAKATAKGARGEKAAFEKVRAGLRREGVSDEVIGALSPWIKELLQKYGPLIADLIIKWILMRFPV